MTAAFTANVDSLAVEINAASGKQVRITKIRIMHSDGTDTTTSDYYTKVKLITETVAGTGGSSFTPVPLDQGGNAAGSTVETGAFTVGTIDKTIDVNADHSNTDFYWEADSDEDKITIKDGTLFGIVLNPAN